MRIVSMAGLAFAVALSGCATSPDVYCRDNPVVCAGIGAVIVGGVIIAASNSGGGGHKRDNNAPPPAPSDVRLKSDLRPMAQLDNGITVYAFRYRGDPRWFAGVSAQEIRADRRLAHAVVTGADGFYRVDYAALGLELAQGHVMAAAGEAAAARLARP